MRNLGDVMFLRGLCAGFGDPLDADLLGELKDRGVQLIRQGGRNNEGLLTPEACAERTAEVDDAGLRGLFVCYALEQLDELPRGAWIEWRNEPDLEGPTAALYRLELRLVNERAAVRGLRLWGGGVSNLTDRGFKYLRAIDGDLPADVAVHWYPRRAWLAHEGHEGRSRTEEVRLLRQIIGPRPFGVSEVGFHTARECLGWWCWKTCRALSDAEAATTIRAEFAFWAAMGAEYAVLYQLNDAAGGDPLNRFGIRRADGTWKPQAEAFR